MNNQKLQGGSHFSVWQNNTARSLRKKAHTHTALSSSTWKYNYYWMFVASIDRHSLSCGQCNDFNARIWGRAMPRGAGLIFFSPQAWNVFHKIPHSSQCQTAKWLTEWNKQDPSRERERENKPNNTSITSIEWRWTRIHHICVKRLWHFVGYFNYYCYRESLNTRTHWIEIWTNEFRNQFFRKQRSTSEKC